MPRMPDQAESFAITSSGSLEIGIDVLDVVIIFQNIQQFQHRSGFFFIQRHGHVGPPFDARLGRIAEFLRQRIAHGKEPVDGH